MSVRLLEQYKLIRQPMFWGLTALVLLMLSLLFQRLCVEYVTLVQNAITHQQNYDNIYAHIIKPLCSWTIVLLAFFIPVFTSLAFSEEFKQKTIYLWAMSRYSCLQIVLGKFYTLLTFCLFVVIFLLVLLSILKFEVALDNGMIASALLAVLLVSLAFISFGLFISSLITTPLLAIGITLLGNVFWMMLEWLNPFDEKISSLASHFSLLGHSYHLLNGILYSPDIVFYFTFCGIWLVFTCVILTYRLRRI